MGSGDLPGTDSGLVRAELQERLDGEVIEITIESSSSTAFTFLSGGIGLLAVRPDGTLRILAYATLYGAVNLDEIPDDPGVLAVAGVNDQGMHIAVTFVVEGETMYLTTILRPTDGGDEIRSVATMRQQVVRTETIPPKAGKKK
ncbi:MAG: hypothetical protein IT462_13465 [Planctomycetes bacterium]|nr:hypothetical protein [Planctomycetota bacterium]